MALLFEEKDRTVVPNWRDFNRTLKLHELANNVSAQHIDISILRPLTDWRSEQNIGIAADLINSAFIAGKTNIPEVGDAINFVLANTENQSLISLAHTINGINVGGAVNKDDLLGNNIEVDPNNLNDLIFPEDERLFRLIHKTRIKAQQQLHNPIPWVELSRLYSLFGLAEKSEKAMTTAINLAPNNRYVLRSATRLLAHLEKYEKALYYLRRSKVTVQDPWLISAHIATSSLMERYSPLIKNGISVIQSKNFSDYDLTELASSLGTLEYKEGSIKKSRDFFNMSLKSPNDNSLAQMEWVSKQDNQFQFNPFIFTEVINPFEAFAFEAKEKNNWNDSFTNCIKWFFDLPYTVRPVLLGSYVASLFLKDQKLSIALCEAGLKANPNDPSILNNIIYSHAMNGTLNECTSYIEVFQRIKVEALPDDAKVSFFATNGLIAFRTGMIDLGKKLYERAIELATKLNNNHLKGLALLSYAKELIQSNSSDVHLTIQKINQLKFDSIHQELFLLREDINTSYQKKLHQ